MKYSPWPWASFTEDSADHSAESHSHPWFIDFCVQLQQADQAFWQNYQLPGQEPQAALDQTQFIQMYQSQWQSRLLDLRSRTLQRQGQSFYTIGSSGHEANAAIAAALTPQDPALLHYRSGAFFIERSKQEPGQTPLYDLLLSFTASRLDPISGGRHKVLGSVPLNIWPQTSTIASHLPKALGAAFAIELKKRLEKNQTDTSVPLPDAKTADPIVICSFGDASVNHASAQAAFNSAAWTSYQGLALPLLMVCEDNQIGISTPTPAGWIAKRLQSYADIAYFTADGRDLSASYHAAKSAADYVRLHRKPAFLHLKTIRLFGHAGADAEATYLSQSQIARNHANDPLWFGAAYILSKGWLSTAQLLRWLHNLEQQIVRVSQSVIRQPKLQGAEAITDSIIAKVHPIKATTLTAVDSQLALQFDKHNLEKPQHIAKLLNWTLHQLMKQYPELILCGEDIAKKGGVYGITQHLVQDFGYKRVINTLLDEQSILGLAIGLAQQGFIAMPEIQFLAYVHNAEDQIRGEAATLPFFSNGQLHSGMVIRIAGLGYQKGFGGHFHNDNSFAVFRDIPGLLVFCPSTGEDAVLMLRQAVRLACEQKRVVIFLEPIALYMVRDLHQSKDSLWLNQMPDINAALPELGAPRSYGTGNDIALLSYGNGHYLCQQASKHLACHHIAVRIIDIRYLVPLDINAIVRHLEGCQNIVIVDECRRRGSLSEELYTSLHEAKPEHFRIQRLCAVDSFIPLGKAAYDVLPSVDDIVQAVFSHLSVHASSLAESV